MMSQLLKRNFSAGPEYGTMEAAWKGSMVEAERLSDLHLSVRDRLVNDVMAQIKNWQKETYHKVSYSVHRIKTLRISLSNH